MKRNSLKKGFTLIETLVAITILMVAIVGPLTIAHKGLLSAIYARDQVGASYLAQDAMEYVKNIRDNNVLQQRDWLFGISGCAFPQNYCTVDTVTGVPSAGAMATMGIESFLGTSCAANESECRIYVGNDGFGHVADGNTRTNYLRYFYLIPLSGNDGAGGLSTEVKVVVVVTWKTGTVANTTIYENEMFKLN